MKTTEYDADILNLTEQVKKLEQRRCRLAELRREELARRFIEANNVTREDVQLSSGEGIPYFGITVGFAEWIKQNNSAKRFVEWNEQIYFMTDFLNNGLIDTGVCVGDLPE